MDKTLISFLLLSFNLEVTFTLSLNKISQDVNKQRSSGSDIPNPNDNTSIFKSIDGSAKLTSCQKNSNFNSKSRVSQLSLHPCTKEPNEIFVRNPENCAGFYYCRQGDPIEGTCPNGLHFHPRKKECIRKTDSECVDKITKKELDLKNFCERSGEGVVVRDAIDCKQYYICGSFGKSFQKNCATDEYYDFRSEHCIKTNSQKCDDSSEIISLCNNKNVGDFIKDPKTCSGWYQCIGDYYVKAGFCPENQWFVSGPGSCQWSKQVSYDDCENRCDGKIAGFVVAPNSKCQRYYKCKQSQPTSGEISCQGKTIFDSKTETCIRKRPDFICEYI